jgi:16S rRNA (cytosine967-C5)-methyltransferase
VKGEGSNSRKNPRKERHVDRARLVAYETLERVDEQDAYANLVLPKALSGFTSRDAAFVTELVAGTLRMQGKYDRIIEHLAKRPLEQLDRRTLRILRLGAHQLLAMRVPAHAALSETVELQRQIAGAKATGFVNGVLRSMTRTDSWDQVLERESQNPDDALGAVFSHPTWIVRALRKALIRDGRDQELSELLAADNSAPSVSLALLDANDLEADLITALAPQLTFAGPSPLGWELESGSPAAAIADLSDVCTAQVQDQGSQLAALALTEATEIRGGERWLDLCAGPGGKTAVLADAAQRSGSSLRANEVAEHRARLVQRATEKFDCDVVQFDGRDEAAYAGTSYHRILVDAPCSGLGALRRRPEARWRKTPQEISKLVALQEELLEAAIAHLEPSGVVAYVTCSPHLAETRGVVDRILKRNPAITELSARHAIEGLASPEYKFGTGLHAQLWPHAHGTDAMFIALLQLKDPLQGSDAIC